MAHTVGRGAYLRIGFSPRRRRRSSRYAIPQIAVAAFLLLQAAVAEAADRFTPGEILIAPRSAQRHDALRARIAAEQLDVLEEDAISGVMRVAVPAGAEDGWIRQFGLDPNVLYAERNGIGEGGGVVIPNDTSFSSQWHHQSGIDADIDTPEAWTHTTGSSAIGVAVLDTGIDSDHIEFVGRIDPDGFDFVNEDSDPEADHPHGTWVSGLLGANGNNNHAVAGVDWDCRILPIKVLDENNAGTTFDLAQGLNYCATQSDIHIISMSLINYPGSSTLINALQNAADNGKILIACAGNGGIGDADSSWPGASPLTIAIGATTSTDARAGFSGTGAALDFVTPGQSVATVRPGTTSDQFDLFSGCSAATPVAAGIASLILDLANQSGLSLTQDDVYDIFKCAAEDQVGPPGEDTPGRDNFFGHGRLNAALALEKVIEIAQVPDNNACDDATVVFTGSTQISTIGATTNGPNASASCAFPGNNLMENDTWYRITAPCSGPITVSICDADFQPRLSVFFGNCPSGTDNPPPIVCDEGSCPGGASVTFDAFVTFIYRIRVASKDGVTGSGTMVITACPPPPTCPADIASGARGETDGVVNLFDLLLLLDNWGTSGAGADISSEGGGDTVVDLFDLLAMLDAWGDCE